MGKWDAYVKGLPRADAQLEGVSDYQAKVNAVKDETKDRAPEELVKWWHHWRSEKDKLDEQLKQVNLQLVAVEQLMDTVFEAQGVARVDLTDGRGARRELSPYPQVRDKALFQEWCVEHGLKNLMHLHPSTATALVKERLEAGLATPDGVEVFVRPKFVRT